MNASDRREFESLVSAACDGTIEAEQGGRLEALLRSDEAYRLAYLQYVDLHARLTVHPHFVSGIPLAPPVAAFTGDDDVVLEIAKDSLNGVRSARNRTRSTMRAWLAFAALVVIAAGVGFALLSAGQPMAAVVDDVSGEAEIVNARDNARNATPGERVLPGESVRTKGPSKFRLRFEDGTTAALAADTTVALEKNSQATGKRIRVQAGAITLDVTPQSVPLTVATDHAEVQVLGTELCLEAGVAATRVDVIEGSVQVTRNRDAKQVKLSQQSFVTVGDSAEPLLAQPLPPRLSAPRTTLPKAGRSVVASADGTLLCSYGLRDTTIWNIHDGVRVASLAQSIWGQASVRFFSDNSRLLIAHPHQGVSVCEFATGGQTKEFVPFQASRGVSVSQSGDWVAAAIHEREIQIYRWDDAKQSLVSHATVAPEPSVWKDSFAISDEGPILSVGSLTGEFSIYDGNTGKLVTRIGQGARSTVSCTAVSPDGRLVAAVRRDQSRILVHDLARHRSWSMLLADKVPVGSIAFSADGKRIAIGLEKGGSMVWDAESGELLLETQGFGSPLNRVCFAANDSVLATADSHGDVRIWEIASANEDDRAK